MILFWLIQSCTLQNDTVLNSLTDIAWYRDWVNSSTNFASTRTSNIIITKISLLKKNIKKPSTNLTYEAAM